MPFLATFPIRRATRGGVQGGPGHGREVRADRDHPRDDQTIPDYPYEWVKNAGDGRF